MKVLIIFLSLVVVGCVTAKKRDLASAWDLSNQFRHNCKKYEDRRTCLDLYKYLKRRTRKGKGDRNVALWCGSNCSDSSHNGFRTCVSDCVDKAMY